MTMQPSDDRVGDRIKARRLLMDKSLRQLAAEAGISHTTLSRMEKGEIPSSNRFHLADIARALHCSPFDLTGVVVPAGPDQAGVLAAGYDTITAFIDADLDFPPPATARPSAPMGELAGRIAVAIGMRQRCDYAGLLKWLPNLIRDLYAATTGPHRSAALAGLIRLAEAASFAVRYTGDPRSASLASDRAWQAATALGDPVMGAFGAWARAHSALGCGLHDRSIRLTMKALGELDGAPAVPGRTEMLGMLYLTLAFSLVGAGRYSDAESPLGEARQLATITGETDTLALMFGPTNVRLWELAIHTDGGDPKNAIPIINQVNPMIIPSQSRQVCFYADAARALALGGNTDQAVIMFEKAEQIAPQRMHGDPTNREVIAGLVDTAHRKAVGSRLLGLASRVGVAA